MFKQREKKGLPEVKIKQEFDQKLVDLTRVTRVVAGGKRLRFRACVAIGDHNGRVGYGIAKGADVAMAVEKAVRQAKKQLLTVPIIRGTIIHPVKKKYKAAKILLRPAALGRGIIAGGVMRIILELSGIKDVTGKILGSRNKINNVKATFEALKSFKLKADK